LRIKEFEWDEGNAIHLQLRHGIEPEEAEEAFVYNPFSAGRKKDITQSLVKPVLGGI